MTKSETAIEKLQRIQELWVELGRAEMHTPQYKTLMTKIRLLSYEYHELVEASKNPKKSN
jgi:hypothetical protein